MDENVRVVLMQGGRHDGRVNVFLRDPSVLPREDGGGASGGRLAADTVVRPGVPGMRADVEQA